MKYEDFELQVGPRSGAGVLVRVLRSPAGEAETLLEIPETGLLRPSRTARDLAPRLRALSDAEVGEQLFRAVFRDEVNDLFLQSLSLAGEEGQGLRIRIRINPKDRGLASLQRLPWELLYRRETEDFLALSRRTPIVRALDVPRSSPPSQVEPPLRILIVAAQQPLHGALDLMGEMASLCMTLRSNPAIEIQVLEHADSTALRRALMQKPFHILHFMGHGVFEHTTGEGAVLFSGPDGLGEAISGRHLATKVKDFAALRLVVLNACSTALAGLEGAVSPFGGVATALVLGGVPAVVAMQSPIADHHAVAFSAAFYNRLAHGAALEEAVTEGRQAVHSLRPESADWAIPILFQRNSSGALLPFLAPHATPRAKVSRRLQRRVAASAAAMLFAAGVAELHPVPAGSSLTPVARWTAWPAPAASSGERFSAEEERSALRRPASVHPPRASGGKRSQAPEALAAGRLRVEISGQPPPGLTDAVRRAGRSIAASGWTLRLQVGPPRTVASSEAGLPWISCSLTAAARMVGHGAEDDLGPIAAVRSKAESGAACDAAVEEMAEEAARRVQKFLKEESK